MQLDFSEEGQKLSEHSSFSENGGQPRGVLPFHRWFESVLSFPPELVRFYLDAFAINDGDVLIDPFCGTGTTMVEAKLYGIESVGIDSFPFAHFASHTKCDWEISATSLLASAEEIAAETEDLLHTSGIDDAPLSRVEKNHVDLLTLGEEETALLIKDSISALPLHKSLVLRSVIEKHADEPYHDHLRLAFAKALVSSIGNLHFGPEVGVRSIKKDSEVIGPWLANVQQIAEDIASTGAKPWPRSRTLLADARNMDTVLPSESVDAVITSPPYPNEKEYTRATRLESVMLGFMTTRTALRRLKRDLIRSNTRGVYKADTDDKWITKFPEIVSLARKIELRRQELGRTSGFEKLYGRVIELYFGGMARHLESLRTILKPGSLLAYVVGDQASFFQIKVETAKLLAVIAESLGYELVRLDFHRNRFSTSTGEFLAEEVLVLRWPGT